MDSINQYLSDFISLAMIYVPKVVLAIVFLIVGLFVIKTLTNFLESKLAKNDFDPMLIPFLSTLLSWILKIALFISILSMVGIEAASFIAVLGAMGLAVGLALQGTLANFAGGVLILLFKPFKIGDYIEAQGHAGTVEEIKIIQTYLKTPDNYTVIIPNASLSNNDMINYTAKGTRRMSLTIGIAYDADIRQAKKIIMDMLVNDPRVLKNPEPQVITAELADNSVNLSVRPWANNDDYWDLLFDLTENIKYKFDEVGIGIPFPQRDIHIISDNTKKS